MYAIELLRLTCEGHFEKMQNFLRVQTKNGEKKLKSVNMVNFISEILEKYSKMITEDNDDLGEKILDFLIETI